MNKFFTIVLPGVAVLYAILTVVWDLPNPVLVLGILAALTALGGLLMGNSRGGYDGEIITTGYNPDTGIPDLALNITVDPRTFTTKDTVRFKSVDRIV